MANLAVTSARAKKIKNKKKEQQSLINDHLLQSFLKLKFSQIPTQNLYIYQAGKFLPLMASTQAQVKIKGVPFLKSSEANPTEAFAYEATLPAYTDPAWVVLPTLQVSCANLGSIDWVGMPTYFWSDENLVILWEGQPVQTHPTLAASPKNNKSLNQIALILKKESTSSAHIHQWFQTLVMLESFSQIPLLHWPSWALTAHNYVPQNEVQINTQLWPLKVVNLNPSAHIFFRHVKAPHDQIELDLYFDYSEAQAEVPLEWNQHAMVILKKNEQREAEVGFYLNTILKLSIQRLGQPKASYTIAAQDWPDWQQNVAPQLLAKGIRFKNKLTGQTFSPHSTYLRLELSQKIDWLVFKPKYMDASQNELHDLMLDWKQQLLVTKDGQHLTLSERDWRVLKELKNLLSYENDGSFKASSKNALLTTQLQIKMSELLPQQNFNLAINSPTTALPSEFKTITPSTYLKTVLRPYQQKGFSWLYGMTQLKHSVCLADDMGLGKTIQTLALLTYHKEQNTLGHSLLVVPLTAIANWEAEIKKFAPVLTVYKHLGSQRQTAMVALSSFDLVITSYATLRNDSSLFEKMEYDWLILDEAQNIKNPTSQISKACKLVKAKHRLAITGTPIENNLFDLWSLFDFLNPGFLGSLQWFKNNFADLIHRQMQNQSINSLKQVVRPYILRRRKQDVQIDLPEKIETEILIPFSVAQENAYKIQLQKAQQGIMIAKNGGVHGKFQILPHLLRLRQICLFPEIANPAFAAIPSAKLEVLQNLISEILSEDHKVIIFSQFSECLKRIREFLIGQKITYAYLDGSTAAAQRQEQINQFQNEAGTKIFLMTLKTGGVALNLTAADYIILFDPWWNPAAEAQAIARSHRIGRTQKVVVYRLIIENSIEQKIIQLQNIKKELPKVLADDDEALASMSLQEMEDLIL